MQGAFSMRVLPSANSEVSLHVPMSKRGSMASYPSNVLPGFLFLGTDGMAHNTPMLDELGGLRWFLCCALEASLPEGCVSLEEHARQSPAADGRGLVGLHIPLEEKGKSNVLESLNLAFTFLEAAKKARQRVLVYCQRGRNRSATVCVAWLIREFGLSHTTALELVRQRRDCVDPNLHFLHELRDFGEHVAGRSPQLSPERLRLAGAAAGDGAATASVAAAAPPSDPPVTLLQLLSLDADYAAMMEPSMASTPRGPSRGVDGAGRGSVSAPCQDAYGDSGSASATPLPTGFSLLLPTAVCGGAAGGGAGAPPIACPTCGGNGCGAAVRSALSTPQGPPLLPPGLSLLRPPPGIGVPLEGGEPSDEIGDALLLSPNSTVSAVRTLHPVARRRQSFTLSL